MADTSDSEISLPSIDDEWVGLVLSSMFYTADILQIPDSAKKDHNQERSGPSPAVATFRDRGYVADIINQDVHYTTPGKFATAATRVAASQASPVTDKPASPSSSSAAARPVSRHPDNAAGNGTSIVSMPQSGDTSTEAHEAGKPPNESVIMLDGKPDDSLARRLKTKTNDGRDARPAKRKSMTNNPPRLYGDPNPKRAAMDASARAGRRERSEASGRAMKEELRANPNAKNERLSGKKSKKSSDNTKPPTAIRKKGHSKAKESEVEEQDEQDDSIEEDMGEVDDEEDEDGDKDEEGDEYEAEDEEEVDKNNPDWDEISQTMVTAVHISFAGLRLPWVPHIRRAALYRCQLPKLRHYYTNYRQWGKLPSKLADAVEAILSKEKEALGG